MMSRCSINGPYPPKLKGEIRSDRGHLSNVDCARALWATFSEERKIFLAHISKNNNTPELARRTVSRTLGCGEERIDCLLDPGRDPLDGALESASPPRTGFPPPSFGR